MNVNNIHWMNYSIAISNEIPQSNLRAGAVLVSENNSLVCSAFSGEEDSMSWSSVLLNKTRKRKKTYVQSAYITINTLSNATFSLYSLKA